jgi:hypothetical protein
MHVTRAVAAGLVFAAAAFCALAGPPTERPAKPMMGKDVVLQEANGVVCAEAEHFCAQKLTKKRGWFLLTTRHQPRLRPDGDPPHVKGAAGGAYLEILPDTRRTHGDRLIKGENFSDEPGKLAVLHYNVHFSTPGRYTVWARVYSTTTEDNSLHVGIDGTWPASGRRLEWPANNRWAWSCTQRTAGRRDRRKHEVYLDVDNPGLHVIAFSMREDGIEFDKWMMTRRRLKTVGGLGPASRVRAGKLPDPFPPADANAATDPNTRRTEDAEAGKAAPPPRRETFDANTDLISLHYDHAPDRDDAHSAAADRTILESMYSPEWVRAHVLAVSGAYGRNARSFREASDAVMDAVWTDRGGWLPGHSRRKETVAAMVEAWSKILSAGGDVWVKEGGQSDLTAEVVGILRKRAPHLDTTRRIHVVQHSGWNEGQTTPSALAFVREHTHYIRIRDANRFLNVRGGNRDFESAARGHPVFAEAWKAAFKYYRPSVRLDFSDTGELMRILGLGEVGIEEFRCRYLAPAKEE